MNSCRPSPLSWPSRSLSTFMPSKPSELSKSIVVDFHAVQALGAGGMKVDTSSLKWIASFFPLVCLPLAINSSLNKGRNCTFDRSSIGTELTVFTSELAVRARFGKSVVLKFIDAKSSCCGGAGLTPHKIRAERSSNGSEIAVAGLTPHKSELSAHQMAPAGAIPHPSPHFLQSDSGASAVLFVLLRLATPALRLGFLLARGNVRRLMYCWLSGITVICRMTLRVQVFIEIVYWTSLKFAIAPWPLWRSRGDGNGGRFARSPCLLSWCGLRLSRSTSGAFPFGPSLVAVH